MAPVMRPRRVRVEEAINYPAGPRHRGGRGRGARRSVNRPFHHWRPRTKEKLCFIKATSGLWPAGREAPAASLGTGGAGGSAAPGLGERPLQEGQAPAQGARGSLTQAPQSLRHSQAPAAPRSHEDCTQSRAGRPLPWLSPGSDGQTPLTLRAVAPRDTTSGCPQGSPSLARPPPTAGGCSSSGEGAVEQLGIIFRQFKWK